MSILTAIFQALLQAICRILPISENFHSALFHDFASRFTANCSALTGVVHIGIALGIIVALFKIFIRMFNEFIFTFKDLFAKRIRGTSKSNARNFMYMSLLALLPLLLWLIPCGSKGFLYTFLHSTQYNRTLLDEGIFMLINALMLVLATKALNLSNNTKRLTPIFAVIVGVFGLLTISLSGFSFVAVVLSFLLIMGVNVNQSFNFTYFLLALIMLVSGIVEICVSVTKVGVVSILLGLIISFAVGFFLTKLMKYLVKKNHLKFFAVYDASVGIIAVVIGIFELILR